MKAYRDLLKFLKENIDKNLKLIFYDEEALISKYAVHFKVRRFFLLLLGLLSFFFILGGISSLSGYWLLKKFVLKKNDYQSKIVYYEGKIRELENILQEQEEYFKAIRSVLEVGRLDTLNYISKEIKHIEKTINTDKILLFRRPVKGEIIDNFNTELSHFGVDFSCMPGSLVFSMEDGIVINIEYSFETEYNVYVQNGNWVMIYAHLSQVVVKKGEKLEKGKLIGYSGGRGQLSAGSPQLHIEIWYNGEPVNPLLFFR